MVTWMVLRVVLEVLVVIFKVYRSCRRVEETWTCLQEYFRRFFLGL